jgi:RimJ/RimL family protein N-acetyltransferase
MKIILETPRLLLRELVPSDLDFLAILLADSEVMRHYPKPCTREEAAAWLDRQMTRYAQYGHGGWLVIERATGQPLGQVGLIPQQLDGAAEREIGYLIHRPFWRRGFASEAAAGVRDYAFATYDSDRLIALVRPENLPSQGVARKIGMQPDRRTMHYDLAHIVFSITRQEAKRLAHAAQTPIRLR